MKDKNGVNGSWVSLCNSVKREILHAAARGPRPHEVAIFKKWAKNKAVSDARDRAIAAFEGAHPDERN